MSSLGEFGTLLAIGRQRDPMSLNGFEEDHGGHRRKVTLHGGPAPWRFVVDMHVVFNFVPGRRRETRELVEWETDWETDFKADFARVIQQSWSRRWPLQPRGSRSAVCDAADWLCRNPERTEVILRVRDNNVPAQAAPPRNGVEVHLVNVHLGESEHAYDPVTDRFELSLTDNDLNRSGTGRLQICSAHEAGHALGLVHPGEAAGIAECRPAPGRRQATRCYYDRRGDTNMMMGSGMYVRQQDYHVFRDMLNSLAEHNSRSYRFGVYNQRGRDDYEPVLGLDRCEVEPGDPWTDCVPDDREL